MSPNCSLLFSSYYYYSHLVWLLLAQTTELYLLLLLQQVLRLRFFRPASFFPLVVPRFWVSHALDWPWQREKGRTAEEREGSRQADRSEPSRHLAHPHRNPLYACWAGGPGPTYIWRTLCKYPGQTHYFLQKKTEDADEEEAGKSKE